MDDLIKLGEVRRATIPGIQIQQLTTQIAQQLGASNARGALVVLRWIRERMQPGRGSPAGTSS